MKKILILLFISILGLQANSCVNMLTQQDVVQYFIKIDYCNNNLYKIELKNSNPYLRNYDDNFTNEEFDKLIDGYKKALDWFSKAKANKVDVEKIIDIKEKNFSLIFTSQNKAADVRILAVGVQSRSKNGIFGITKEDELKKFITSLEKVKNESAEQMKKTQDMFK